MRPSYTLNPVEEWLPLTFTHRSELYLHQYCKSIFCKCHRATRSFNAPYRRCSRRQDRPDCWWLPRTEQSHHLWTPNSAEGGVLAAPSYCSGDATKPLAATSEAHNLDVGFWPSSLTHALAAACRERIRIPLLHTDLTVALSTLACALH